MEVIILHTLLTLVHTVCNIYCAYYRDHKGNWTRVCLRLVSSDSLMRTN